MHELFSLNITIWQGKQGIGEGNDCEEHHKQERLHVIYDNDNQSSQVTEVLEDTEEI